MRPSITVGDVIIPQSRWEAEEPEPREGEMTCTQDSTARMVAQLGPDLTPAPVLTAPLPSFQMPSFITLSFLALSVTISPAS